MSKKTKTINLIDKILIIYIFLQPLLDIFTSMMLHYSKGMMTIGEVIRVGMLLFFLSYFFFIKPKTKNFKKITIYLILIGIYSVLFSLHILNLYGKAFIFTQIKGLLKTFYFPIILVLFYDILSRKNMEKYEKILKILFVIYGLLVFIPNFFHIGFKSYQVTKVGSIGLFYTANEISAIISILMPFFIIYLIEKKNLWSIFLSSIILLYTLTSMGTKGPLISLGIILVILTIKYIKEKLKNKQYKNITIVFISLISFIFLLCIFIPKTSFWKNMVIHLDFLQVDEISDMVDNPKNIDRFIFSDRLTFLKNTNKIYYDANLKTKLLGLGYETDDGLIKAVEMDYFDILYSQGIIGFLLVMISFSYIFIKIIKKYRKIGYENYSNLGMLSYKLSISLILLLSLLTGHVITAPSVSIYVALIFVLFYNKLYEGDTKYEKTRDGHS